MREIAFHLTLDTPEPDLKWSLEALQQVADQIVGHPVKMSPDASRAANEQIGVVTAASVEGDRVRCIARVEDWVPGFPGQIGGPVTGLSVVGERATITDA